MKILGISAYYHDSAAALVDDSQIIAAAQEERFTRKRHDEAFPKEAIAFCLKQAGITASQLDAVVFYEKPFLKFGRILETALQSAPGGLASFLKSMPVWIHDKLWIKDSIAEDLDYHGKILFTEHHEAHAASAFYPSPFEEAAVLTLDGVGEWASSSLGIGEGNKLVLQWEQRFPHSLGLLYSAFTYYTGFKVNSGEYKVMGLAPYGQPLYKNLILEKLMDLKADGSFRLNMDYFAFAGGLRMTNSKFDSLFGGPARQSEARLSQREMDLAASVQAVTEEVVLRMARHARKLSGKKNLCLAGGVALNCVANGAVLREGIFEKIWIQPAAGDAGGALGAALAARHMAFGLPRQKPEQGRDAMQGAYLGSGYSDAEIAQYLDSRGLPYEKLDEAQMAGNVAALINEEKVLGWFQGRMEFGPRALGARSILGDARSPKMQETMNLKIKFRESFRPFAPAVLAEKAPEYFELDAGVESPYMLLVAPVKESQRLPLPQGSEALWGIEKLKVQRSKLPAITHVDYSARIQTVDAHSQPRYHALLSAMQAQTGCPILVNTSFNVRGEPIVESPAEAYLCFMRTGIDCLVLGNCLLRKEKQPELKEAVDWRAQFELD